MFSAMRILELADYLAPVIDRKCVASETRNKIGYNSILPEKSALVAVRRGRKADDLTEIVDIVRKRVNPS